jgi:hypothetical protein
MFSKNAQKQIGRYLAGMVLIHAYVFYSEWHRAERGWPDFSIFYTAAKILAQGQGADLYNDSLQESVQRSFSPAVAARGSILPFNHPPFEALVFWPFAHFSFYTAYRLWLVINLGLLATAMLVLRRSLPVLGKAPVWLWLLAGLGFPPVAIALLQGQDSIWLLLCYCVAFAMYRRGADYGAGFWLGLGLCKFHMILFFMFGPLIQKRWRVIVGFGATAIGLVVVSVAALGRSVVMEYPRYAWWTDHVRKFRWNFMHSNTPNLRGMILSFLPPRLWPTGEILVVIASVAVLIAASYFWWRGEDSDQGRELAFAAGVVATVLVSYHTWVQDLSLLFLPVVVLLDSQLQQPEMNRRLARTIQILCALFFYSPIYIYLVMRFEQLQLITWLILLLFFLIGGAIAFTKRTAGEPVTAAQTSGT